MVQCIFETHAHIATVAKILDCPVLSNDSDFYIFGVKWISVNSLATPIERDRWSGEYMMPCKLWRSERISNSFPRFNVSALPIAVVILGNDDAKLDICERIFAGMSPSRRTKRLYCDEQIRIDTLLRWLQYYNLDDATAAILSKMPKDRRRELVCKIELVVNRYLALPCDMLEPLGLANKYRNKIAELGRQKEFRFSGDIDSLDASKFWSAAQLAASEDFSLPEQTEPVSEPVCARAVVDTWPAKFTRHYYLGNLPGYFVNMMVSGSFNVYIQMENFEYPSAHAMSMKIIRVIHGLLVAGRPDESDRGLTYTIREGRDLAVRHADTIKGTRTTRFPAFSDLVETPKTVRKQIFDDTLEISGLDALIDDVPEEWRLYVIAIVYWMRQPDEPLRNSRHMHAVLFAMLLGVVDRNIGAFYRSMELFNDRYGESLVEIKSKRHEEQSDQANEESDSIVEALKSVCPDDCLLAAPMFIKLCEIEDKLRRKPLKFNVTIVHVFAQFLGCIKEALHLNSLLGYPYKPVNIGHFFNGTMLYNLFTGSEKVSDVEAWNCEILGESPSICRLLKLLTAKVKEIIAAASINDCGSVDSRKISEDEPSEEEGIPDEVSAAQSQSVDLQAPLSTLSISSSPSSAIKPGL